MEELINQIIEIEEKAQEVVRDARAAGRELENRIKADSVRMEQDIEKQMTEKNESLRQIEEDDASKRVEEIKAEQEKTVASLEEKYRENKDKWVEEIVSGVIGG